MGWRDPFIFERKGLEGNGCEWGMLLGSGLKDGGGAVMIYRSENLRGGAAPARGRAVAAGQDAGAWQGGTARLGVPLAAGCHGRQASGLRALWGGSGRPPAGGCTLLGQCLMFGMWC